MLTNEPYCKVLPAFLAVYHLTCLGQQEIKSYLMPEVGKYDFV